MTPISRRDFLKTAAVASAAAALPSFAAEAKSAGNILGLDNFAVRAMKWKGIELIDYAVKLKTNGIFITDLPALGATDTVSLKKLKSYADSKGVKIYLGTWSICPTSKSFKKDWGTAEEHLTLALKTAAALGSPALRVILGNNDDRRTEGGIEARIADTVKILKAARSMAMDYGVKIAMENHAGDMQARELVQLIEAAGKEFVGANMDSGNAAWTAEDPLQSLETLAPYVLTTSLRDSLIWESENGATVQWTAMGEGNVGMENYLKRFRELCPNAPLFIETIGGFNREIAYLKPEFWKSYPNMRASELARFVALAKKGKSRPPGNANDPEFQRGEIERSIEFCRKQGFGPQNV